MNNQNVINEIRSKIDIVELVSEYVSLTKKGQYYWGVCPFHNDKNPSMSVSTTRQTFTCWSCHTSGNVYNFIQLIENLDFPSTLKFLANKAGVTIGNTVSNYDKKNEKLFEIYDITSKYYQLLLNTQEGIVAKEYLKNRGIDSDIIKEFGIGLSSNNKTSLTNYLKQRSYDINTLDNIGLVNGDNDTFINRIMFPLHDRFGRVVAFSGRIYDNSNMSKYMNTKETNIFKKGHCLYNYYNCKEYVRKEKSVIIMEGFMDVIRASTIGIKNTVALMGTALTDEQISLIKKLSLNVYLCLDGDDPGQVATMSVGEHLENAGLTVKVIPLKNNDDPDTYILKNGKDKFISLIENALNFSDFKIERLKVGINLKSDIELANYINKVIKEASLINDEIRREIILKKLANETNLSYTTLEKKLNEFLLNKEKKDAETILPMVKEKVDKYTKAAIAFLYYMIISPTIIKVYEDKNIYFANSVERSLAAEISYYYHEFGDIVIADFYTYLKDKTELLELYERIMSLDLDEVLNDEAIKDYINVIDDYNMRQEVLRLKELMKTEVDELEKAKIAERIRLLRVKE